MPQDDPLLLVFVCLGNICRSPTAEAVMAARVAEAGLEDRIVVDSAGTSGWHIGDAPDRRARQEAARRGVPMVSRGRQVEIADFHSADLLLAMDRQNLADLHDLAPQPQLRTKAVLLRSFDPGIDHQDPEVPDPYYGGADGFAEVFDQIDAACRGLLEVIVAEHGLRRAEQRDAGHAR